MSSSASNRKRKSKNVALKIASIVAIFFLGTLGLMVGTQAAGMDIFGAFARWTEETFNFVIDYAGDPGNNPDGDLHLDFYHSLRQALEHCGIPQDLAPTWFPEGFQPSEPILQSNDVLIQVYCACSNAEGESFSIVITRYYSMSDIELITFEKDNSPVEVYEVGAKTFYIMSNLNTNTATWSSGPYVICIFGALSASDIKSIIDSIGR